MVGGLPLGSKIIKKSRRLAQIISVVINFVEVKNKGWININLKYKHGFLKKNVTFKARIMQQK